MNKTELVAAIAQKAELSKKDAEKAVKAFTEVVAKELKKGGKVQLVGFGTFEVAKRAAREGRNPQSGLSDGVSSDFRDLAKAAEEGNKAAKTALETYTYHVGKYIGAYAAAMGGVDAIAFTAGVGENDADTRAAIGEYMAFLDTKIDPVKNKVRGEERIISTDDSKVDF